VGTGSPVIFTLPIPPCSVVSSCDGSSTTSMALAWWSFALLLKHGAICK
jgi:hypothetical protein